MFAGMGLFAAIAVFATCVPDPGTGRGCLPGRAFHDHVRDRSRGRPATGQSEDKPSVRCAKKEVVARNIPERLREDFRAD